MRRCLKLALPVAAFIAIAQSRKRKKSNVQPKNVEETNAIRDEAKRKLEKPMVTESEALDVCAKRFGLRVSKIKVLESYDDANFYIQGIFQGEMVEKRFVLKIHNGVESDNPKFVRASNALFNHLSREDFHISAPVPLPTLKSVKDNEKFIAWCEFQRKPTDGGGSGNGKRRFAVRLLKFVDGVLMNEIYPLTPRLVRESGEFLGRLRNALDMFPSKQTEGFCRDHLWDLRRTEDILYFLDSVKSPSRRELVRGVVEEFRSNVLPKDSSLPHAVLHTDFNDANVLVSCVKDGRISGVIDFGDSVRSWRVNDIAIAVAYLFVMLHRTIPHIKTDKFSSKDSQNLAIEALSYFMDGVSRVYDLSALEVSLIPVLAACRLSISGRYFGTRHLKSLSTFLHRILTSSSSSSSSSSSHDLFELVLLSSANSQNSPPHTGTMGSYSYSLDPTNEYLKEHAEPAWSALRTIRERVTDVRKALKNGHNSCTSFERSDGSGEKKNESLLSPGEYYSN